MDVLIQEYDKRILYWKWENPASHFSVKRWHTLNSEEGRIHALYLLNRLKIYLSLVIFAILDVKSDRI